MLGWIQSTCQPQPNTNQTCLVCIQLCNFPLQILSHPHQLLFTHLWPLASGPSPSSPAPLCPLTSGLSPSASLCCWNLVCEGCHYPYQLDGEWSHFFSSMHSHSFLHIHVPTHPLMPTCLGACTYACPYLCLPLQAHLHLHSPVCTACTCPCALPAPAHVHCLHLPMCTACTCPCTLPAPVSLV
jgi:hypothetical protein